MNIGGTPMKKGGKPCYAIGGAGKINHEEMTPAGKPKALKKGGKAK
jgi:hypothetical protein